MQKKICNHKHGSWRTQMECNRRTRFKIKKAGLHETNRTIKKEKQMDTGKFKIEAMKNGSN